MQPTQQITRSKGAAALPATTLPTRRFPIQQPSRSTRAAAPVRCLRPGHNHGLGQAPNTPPTRAPPVDAVASAEAATGSLSAAIEEYNKNMIAKMGWRDNPYEYHPELGLYYHFLASDMVCGSQPRTPADIDRLVEEEGVRAILNLQQDKDLKHWGVDLRALEARCAHHAVPLIRTPAVDFDPHSLRSTLPAAAAALQRARAEHGRVYVHCTAGLGRSPAACIAALYWFGDMQLEEAYSYLTAIRPCGPNKDAIRGATYDLLSGRHWDGFHGEPWHAFATLGDHDRARIRDKLRC